MQNLAPESLGKFPCAPPFKEVQGDATQKKAGLGRSLVEDKSSWICQTLRKGAGAAAALISVLVLSWRKMWEPGTSVQRRTHWAQKGAYQHRDGGKVLAIL